MRPRNIAFFLLLLVPSALYVWKNPDMPEFGRLHDDGLLYVSAKSLATGHGFRILSLPEEPAQTKYPILYPLYLSVAWRINPRFPDNLWAARLLSWFLLIVCLALSWKYLREEGFSEKRTMVLMALLGLSPYMILFGTTLFSEIFFMCWLLGAFLAGRRDGLRMALLAGILAGFAYLTRTAGIVLLFSMPAWYLWRREARRGVAFAAGMLPFIAGWMWWSHGHTLHTSDDALIYYTDYMKFELMNVGLKNIHIVVWKNLDSLLYGMGSFAIPQAIGLLPVKILTQVLGVAMISGIVRLFRRGVAVQYTFFAILSSAMFLVWDFPPNERFVLPACPLLLAGLLTELEHLAGMLKTAFRSKDTGQRVVAAGMGAALAAILLGALGLQCAMSFRFLYGSAEQARAKLVDMRAAYSWIAANVPLSANVLSNDDPILYLYSGRRGHLVLPHSWYQDDDQGTLSVYRNIAGYCQSHGFDYFYSNADDVARWTEDPKEADAVQRAVQQNADLIPEFHNAFGTVYRVRDASVSSEHGL